MSAPYPPWVAYEPGLVPPPEVMAWEGIEVLEEWFRWGEEWSVLLRALAGLGRTSRVLEIGCGLGRIAFPLRYVLGPGGSYDGFDIVARKIDFLERFTEAHPDFRFVHADVLNSHYNPGGNVAASQYRFPYPNGRFDVVFAASVFTHMAPDNAARYFQEAARVLRPGGKCLFSFFLLDHYQPGATRAHGFDRPDFSFDHQVASQPGWAAAFPEDPERMTAFSLDLVRSMAAEAGLEVTGEPLPGYWSGRERWVGAQDLVVLAR